jgi:hypothetical protein
MLDMVMVVKNEVLNLTIPNLLMMVVILNLLKIKLYQLDFHVRNQVHLKVEKVVIVIEMDKQIKMEVNFK